MKGGAEMSFTRKEHISFIAITMLMLTIQIMNGAVGFCMPVEPIRIGGEK